MMQTPIVFIGVLTITNLTIFNLSLNGMYINRTFLNIPISLIDTTVIKNTDSNYDIKYYFLEEELKENVIKYLSSNLKNKIKNYKIAFKFYSYQNGEIDEDQVLNNAVNIKMVTTYYLNFTFSSSINFHIENGIVQNE